LGWLELARCLHVGRAWYGRTLDGTKQKYEPRRSSDESEKGKDSQSQQEVEGRRGTETGKAIAESAAAAAV
jgi:hypothetical protein